MKVRRATAEEGPECARISRIRSAQELKNLVGRDDTQWLVIENDDGKVVGIGIINFWSWNKVAWVWDLTVDESEKGKGYGRALLLGMLRAAKKMGATVLMDFGTPKPEICSLVQLYLKNGFRVCGMNDRWFGNNKDTTAIFYGHDL